MSAFLSQFRINRRKIRMKGHSRSDWRAVQLNILSLMVSQSKWLKEKVDIGKHVSKFPLNAGKKVSHLTCVYQDYIVPW